MQRSDGRRSRLAFRRRELPPLSEARARASAVVLADGRAAVIGGGTRGREAPADGVCEVRCWSSAAVDVVDVAREVVTRGPPLRVARESARAVAVGRRVMVMGGVADHG